MLQKEVDLIRGTDTATEQGLSHRTKVFLVCVLSLGAFLEVAANSFDYWIQDIVEESLSLVGLVLIAYSVLLLSKRAGARYLAIVCISLASVCVVGAQVARFLSNISTADGHRLIDPTSRTYDTIVDLFDGLAPGALVLGFFLLIFQLLRVRIQLADHTEQLRQEARIRACTEEALSEALELAQVGHWKVDPDTETVSGSDELFRIFGLSHDESTLSDFLDVVHPEDRDADRELTMRGIKRGVPWEIEHRLLCKDGTLRYVHKKGEVIANANGDIIELTGTVQDVTERKRVEAEARALEQRMLQSQKLESLGVMAGGIAHDFNNILHVILGNTDIALMDTPPEASSRDCLLEIQKATRHASELTRQMAAYSGTGAMSTEIMDLSQTVRDMAHLLEVSITIEAKVTYRIDESLPIISGDPSQLRQLVMNLVTNASESMGDGSGSIVVETGVTPVMEKDLTASFIKDLLAGDWVYLKITDTGCGMDKDTQHRIFEPFFTTRFTGRGLGMAAVLGIVRAHEGAIHIESEVGTGTTVTVLFPIQREPEIPISDILPEEEEWSPQGTVLVVDDESGVRNLTKTVLEREGFRVLTAEDGRRGADVFAEHQDEIVCVLLDLTMPHMDGRETLYELHQIRNEVPVVLLTGRSEEQAREQIGTLNCAGFLRKPVSGSALLNNIRTILLSEEGR